MMWLTLLALACSTWRCSVPHGDDTPVGYYLYTPANPSQPQKIQLDDTEAIQASHFDVRRPTKIIIHGFSKSYLEIPNKEIRTAYQARGAYNIISMDWSEVAALNYVDTKPLVPLVGIQCARFVRFLAREFGLDLADLVLVGHSMGAHVAGFCGKELQKISRGEMRLGNIVALEAALPLYRYANPHARLSNTDADYVMAIHSNGLRKGFLAPLGHADFYANGGQKQPGCGVDLSGHCAHARVVYLYAEAVQQRTSFAPFGHCPRYADLLVSLGRCQELTGDLVQLGDPLEVSQVKGIFTFETNPWSPYGRPLA
ncbi:phospholipase A1-like [Drosophila rhopaloa]|uniref:Lipase domain-containing protein n=1 Tax=Drosophila rhopaloa TaxID=1041015 RepID=A0ABM5I519_DRORH|nr:phospholipase A1-like [Drosophila rhopaloa]